MKKNQLFTTALTVLTVVVITLSILLVNKNSTIRVLEYRLDTTKVSLKKTDIKLEYTNKLCMYETDKLLMETTILKDSIQYLKNRYKLLK